MKKLITSFTLCILMLFATTAYGAQTTVSVVVGGQTLGVNGVVVDGRTLLPVRDIAEALGATVGWDNKGGKVTISKPVVSIGSAANTIYGETRTIAMAVGSDKVYVNGIESGTLDVPAQVIDGKTMVPVRAVSGWFDATVEWQKESNTVKITPALNGSLDEAVLNKELIAGKEHQVMDQMNADVVGPVVSYVDNKNLSHNGLDLIRADNDINGQPVAGKWVFNRYSITGIAQDPVFVFTELTDEFMAQESGEGVFDGIRIIKNKDMIYFSVDDLTAKGILTK